MLFLSVDFGTSAVKMSILDEAGHVLDSGRGEYRYLILPGEKNELRKEDLLGALYAAAGTLDPDLRRRVDILCYDTFSPSPVFLDRDGDLVYPNIITHLDRRSRAQGEEIDHTIGRDAYQRISGIYPFAGGCSAMTFLWFKEMLPEVLDRSFAVGHLPTYVHHLFTGKWMCDLVNASMTGLYETTTQGTWSSELLSAFGLAPEKFPEIRNPGTVSGTLRSEIASRLGVPAGIDVCIGTNDMAAAQMGAGNRTAGGVMITTGSSEMVSILTDKPVTDPGYYLRNAALPGLWQIYVTTCGGFGLDWFREQFCREMDREAFYAYTADVLKTLSREGAGGVTFDPYLTGDRQSMEKKTGAWHGLTLAATRDQMLGAYLEAIQDVLLSAIRKAERILPLDPVIRVSGGMATREYLDYKKTRFVGYGFSVAEDCPTLGNAELAKYYWKDR